MLVSAKIGVGGRERSSRRCTRSSILLLLGLFVFLFVVLSLFALLLFDGRFELVDFVIDLCDGSSNLRFDPVSVVVGERASSTTGGALGQMAMQIQILAAMRGQEIRQGANAGGLRRGARKSATATRAHTSEEQRRLASIALGFLGLCSDQVCRTVGEWRDLMNRRKNGSCSGGKCRRMAWHRSIEGRIESNG